MTRPGARHSRKYNRASQKPVFQPTRLSQAIRFAIIAGAFSACVVAPDRTAEAGVLDCPQNGGSFNGEERGLTLSADPCIWTNFSLSLDVGQSVIGLGEIDPPGVLEVNGDFTLNGGGISIAGAAALGVGIVPAEVNVNSGTLSNSGKIEVGLGELGSWGYSAKLNIGQSGALQNKSLIQIETSTLNNSGTLLNTAAHLSFANGNQPYAKRDPSRFGLFGLNSWEPADSWIDYAREPGIRGDLGLYIGLRDCGATGSCDDGERGTLNNTSTGYLKNTGLILSRSGTLNNSGFLLNTGTLYSINGGELQVGENIAYVTAGIVNNSGLLINAGYLRSEGDFNNSGNLVNDYGAELRLRQSALRGADPTSTLTNRAGAVLTNYGTINLGTSNNFGGALLDIQASSTARNELSGEIINNGSAILNSGTLINEGALFNKGTLSNVNLLQNKPDGEINNEGTLTNRTLVNHGILTNQAGGTLTNVSGNNGGFIRNYSGGTLTNAGLFLNYANSPIGQINGSVVNYAGGTLTNSGRFLNGELNNYGTVEITEGGQMVTGACNFPQVSCTVNRVGSTLTGGTWKVIAGSGTAQLNIGSGNIFTLAAGTTVLLSGEKSYFGQLDTLTNNAGSLTIGPGRTFTTFNSTFANSGDLTTLAGGIVNNLSIMRNYAGATVANSGMLTNTFELRNYAGASLTNSGRLNNYNQVVNDGDLNNNGLLYNRGTLLNQVAGTLTNISDLRNFAGASLTNSGTLNNNNQLVNYGDLSNNRLLFNRGTLLNQASGTLTNTSDLRNYAGANLTNSGRLNNNNQLVNYGDLSNNRFLFNLGTLFNQAGGALSNNYFMSNTGELINQAGGTLSNNNNLTNESGGVLFNSGMLSNNSALFNHGTLNNSGSVSNAGLLSGSGTFNNTGTLEVVAGGNAQITLSSNISVTPDNDLTLTGGTWNVLAGNGTASLAVGSGIASGNISTLAAGTDVTLAGINSQFDQLNALGQNAGTLTIQDNRIFDINGTFTNTGALNSLNSGNLINHVSLQNDGIITNRNAFLSNANGAILTNSGTLNNSEGLFINGGTLQNQAGGTITNDTGAHIANGGFFSTGPGTIEIQYGSSLSNRGTISGGTLNNAGSVSVVDGGSVNVDQSDNLVGGTLTGGFWNVNGSAASSSLQIGTQDITRLAAGTDVFLVGAYSRFDQLNALSQNDGFLQVGFDRTFTINGDFSNEETGEIRTAFNARIYSNGEFNNSGMWLNSFSSAIDNTGTLVNSDRGTITNSWDSTVINSGTLRNAGQFTNNATVENHASLSNLTGGVITNDGTFDNIAGDVTSAGTVDGTGIFNQTAGSLTVNGTMQQDDININGGSVFGNGSIESAQGVLIASGASLNPGESVGRLDIVGDLDLDGIFNIEIESLTSYDLLDITGTLDLFGGSMLDVDLLGGYLPEFGNSFDILTADNILGEFDLTLLPALGGGLGWEIDYLIDYDFDNTDLLRLSVVNAVPIPAAVWLFGSGLLVMLGIGRRKQTSATAN